jgi:DNA repair protein RadC
MRTLTIKEMPVSERPYERIERFGAASLTDAELIAVIIKSGYKEQTAVDIARELLRRCGSGGLVTLTDMELDELRRVKGIGRVKAIQIKALCELARRMNGARNVSSHKMRIRSTGQIAEILMGEMSHLKKEVLKAVLLDRKLQIIKISDVSVGTIDQALVHPREVFSDAIRNHASTIIIAHNHPTGHVEPSEDDINTTKRLILVGDIVGIEVIDHIIIGNGTYHSMHASGIMKKILESIAGNNIN